MNHTLLKISLCLLAYSTCVRADQPIAPPKAHVEISSFGQRLLQTIGNSDAIAVIEHSDRADFVDPKSGRLQAGDEIVYSKVDLSSAQRAQFKSLAAALAKREMNGAAACAPRPHYTFAFYKSGEKFDQIEVCFECMTVNWFGSAPSVEFFRRLEPFVVSLGMQPRSNWYQRAHQEK